MKLLRMSNFTSFHNVFYAICILRSLTATFKLLPAASLNLGRFQNGVLGNAFMESAFFKLFLVTHLRV